MDGKLSSREIEWKWNHDDPMVGSLGNSLDSHDPFNITRVIADDGGASKNGDRAPCSLSGGSA